MSFRDIKGQDRAILFLKGTLTSSRVAHAYIFFGPEGIGKKLAALNFAKALNCASNAFSEPCDNCISCKKIDNMNHPDIFLLEPEKEGVSLKIEKIRELIKNIALKAYEGKRKVYIINDAHLATQEAQNALLKTLEEPPSASVVILITDKIGSLYSTIRSRAQVVKFFPLKVDAVKAILIKAYKMEDVKAHILAGLAAGSAGKALRYADADIFDKRNTLLRALASVKAEFFNLDFFEDVPKERLRLYLDMMLAWYRDILVAKTVSGEVPGLVNIDRREEISSEAKNQRIEKVADIINQIISMGSFLDQNANPKLAMSVLGLKIHGA